VDKLFQNKSHNMSTPERPNMLTPLVGGGGNDSEKSQRNHARKPGDRGIVSRSQISRSE
jgi:hypothetical protein